jgi:hypothetical protein
MESGAIFMFEGMGVWEYGSMGVLEERQVKGEGLRSL